MMETVGESTRKSIFVKKRSQTSSDRAPETIVISKNVNFLLWQKELKTKAKSKKSK